MSLEHLSEGSWEFLEETFTAKLLDRSAASLFEERWIVAPHRNLIWHLQKLTAQKAGAVSGLRFMDLRQVARRILLLSGSTVAPELDRVARDLIIRQVVKRQFSVIEKAFGSRVALTPAFMGAVTKTLNDLREAGISVEKITALAGKKPGLSSVRLEVVADLFASYLDRLGSINALDDEDMLAAAVGLLKKGEVTIPDRIYVYGIYDLTAGQNSLLDTLTEVAEVEQFVPVYPETEAYSGQLLERWRSRANHVESAGDTTTRTPDGSSLDELWSTLSCTKASAIAGTKASIKAGTNAGANVGTQNKEDSTITVVSAPGRNGEIDSALRLVAAAWQGGTCSKETRLVAVSPDSYQTLLSQKLESNDFRYHRSEDQSDSQDREEGKIDPKRAALLLVRKINGLISENEAGVHSDETGLLSDETGKSLAALKSSIPKTATWSEWTERLHPILKAMFEKSMHDPILDMLEKLRRLSVTGESADRSAMRWALGRILRDTRADDVIPLEGIMGLRGTRSELVIVVGMAEGSWPARPLPDPLLLDDEREILNEGEQWKLPTMVRRKDEERLLFRLLLESGKHVVFVYSRIDEQGGLHRASPHVLDVMQQVLDRRLPQEQLEKMARRNTRAVGAIRSPAGEPRLGALDRDLIAVADAIAGDGFSDLHALWGCLQFGAGFRMEKERWRGEPGPYAGFLTGRDCADIALKLLGLSGDGHFSASLLEEYARCPWRVFTTRVLGLVEEEEPDGLLSPARMGLVMHDVLSDYVSRASGEGRWPPARDQIESDSTLIAEMARQGIADQYAKRGMHFPPLEGVDSRRIIARLLGWLLWESTAGRGSVEAGDDHAEDIGDSTEAAALGAGAAGGWHLQSVEEPFETELTIAGRTLNLKGRWDRIDRNSSDLVRILDYKTGRAKPGPADDLEGGLNLQMPLYLLAAEKELGSTDSIAGGILLQLPISSSGKGPHITSWEQSAEVTGREETERLLDQLLMSIESGVFTRLPHEKRRDSRTGLCAGCPTPSICRAWRTQESQRHLESDELQPLNAARKIGGRGGQGD